MELELPGVHLKMAQVNADNKIARRLVTLYQWSKILIAVQGPNTLFIAASKEELETPGPTGLQQGVPYTQASTTPPANPSWIGELWYIGSAPGTLAEVTIPRLRGETT